MLSISEIRAIWESQEGQIFKYQLLTYDIYSLMINKDDAFGFLWSDPEVSSGLRTQQVKECFAPPGLGSLILFYRGLTPPG